MSEGSPPSLVGGFSIRKSSRKVKLTEKGKRYQANMSAAKLTQCFTAKERIFAQAASVIAMREDPKGCCAELEKLKSDIEEIFDALKVAEAHEQYQDEYNAVLDSIVNMVGFLKGLGDQKPADSNPTDTSESVAKHTGAASSVKGEESPGSNNADAGSVKGTMSPTKTEHTNDFKGQSVRPKDSNMYAHLQSSIPVVGQFVPPVSAANGAGGPNLLSPFYTEQTSGIKSGGTGGQNFFFGSNVEASDSRSGGMGGPNLLYQASPNAETNRNIHHSSASHDRMSNFAGGNLLNTAQNNPTFKPTSSTELLLSQMLQRSRVEIPKQQKFYGDPLKFASWARGFQSFIVQTGLPTSELFPYLKESLGGAAWEAVDSLQIKDVPNLYEEAVNKLRRNFGDPIIVANAYVTRLSEFSPIPSNNTKKLRQFFDALESCQSAKEVYPTLNLLDFPPEMNKIIAKLPAHMVTRWNRKANDSYHKHGRLLNFDDLCSFVKREVEIATNPFTCPVVVVKGDQKSDKKGHGGSSKSTASSFNTESKETKKADKKADKKPEKQSESDKGTGAKQPKCYYCSKGHWLDKCEKILKIDMNARHQFIQATRLCFSCLRKGHFASNCRYRLTCRICKRRHATILHKEGFGTQTESSNMADASDHEEVCTDDEAEKAESANTSVVSLKNSIKLGQRCSMVVPVWIFAVEDPTNKHLCYAALDTQSSCTFVLSSLADKFSVPKVPTKLSLSTMGQIDQLVDSEKISGLGIKHFSEDETIPLPPCFSRDIMPSTKDHVATSESVKNWPHLSFLEKELPPLQEAEISILVGYDCPAALCPISVVTAPRSSGSDCPYAVKTKLGWSIVGSVGPTLEKCESAYGLSLSYPVENDSGVSHLSSIVFKTTAKELSPSQITDMFNRDFDIDKPSDSDYSQDDIKFLNCIKNNVTCSNKRYTAPLPFKTEPAPILPENVKYAELRLAKLKQKMEKNEQFKKDYLCYMNDLISSGYAEIVPDSEIKNSSWYLPHHGVYHPKRPDKIRIVFDASAKFHGVCLNDVLLSGPDMTNSLLGVLLRFRTENVAVTCDIQKMFFQFFVSSEHRDYLRFLWYKNSNLGEEIVHYRMKAHIFGATSSPSVSNFCLKQIASDNSDKFGPEVCHFVSKCFYVDDGLLSLKSVQEIVNVVLKTREMLSYGSLVLHKFASSSNVVLKALESANNQRDSIIVSESISCKAKDSKNKKQALRVTKTGSKSIVSNSKSSGAASKTSADSETGTAVSETGAGSKCSTVRKSGAVSKISAMSNCVSAKGAVSAVSSSTKQDCSSTDATNLDTSGTDRNAKLVELPGCSGFEKALGLSWDTSTDSFVFKLSLPQKPYTRRGVLSIVSSVFDPMGLVSPYLLEGKRIMQEICKTDLDWDTPLPPEMIEKFCKWGESLHKLENICIPRCVKPKSFESVKTVQVHVFCDASTRGYGSCAYLRIVDESDNVTCTLIAAKSRILPSKAVTIPRLELNAAVVGAKLGFMINNELKTVYKNIDTFYWSDSSVTLGYIKNSAKRFHTFVSNRVQIIQDLTSDSAWFYVNTVQNPADLASRGIETNDQAKLSLWLKGPPFLHLLDINPYLQVPNNTVATTDPEVKPSVLNTKVTQMFDLNRFSHCSTWDKLISAVLLCIQFFMFLFKLDSFCSTVRETITLSDIKTVKGIEYCKRIVFKLVQAQHFSSEIRALSAGNLVSKSSSLFKLHPFLDKFGILRVGGRLRTADIDFDAKYPVVFPSYKNCFVTRLLIEHYHRLVGHQGRNLTLTAMRSHGIWALGSTTGIASVVDSCFHCKRLYGKLQLQQMADLPECRVKPTAPFTYVGTDVFGPFYVKEGRKSVKRYCLIFICMASRAVHFEVSCSLSTDAFLSSLRRLIAIRGPIRTIYCDKGTNFVGADAELKAAAKELDKVKISDFLRSKLCDYVHFEFHVPHASHFGGAWERNIRSARRILVSLLKSQGGQLTDETLRTLMYEVAALINSRPLTAISSSQDLQVPLCPQNLLTAKSGVVMPPPGSFEESDIYTKKHWRRVQYLCNVFLEKVAQGVSIKSSK